LKKYSPADIKDNPLAIYDAFLQVVIWEYDSALWGFREPVRNIEKVCVTTLGMSESSPIFSFDGYQTSSDIPSRLERDLSKMLSPSK
jgi:hypothetical protein